MRAALYRTEPGRYPVDPLCRGEGVVARNGTRLEYAGIDVSRRGFGCVVKGYLNAGDTAVFNIGNRKITMQVMWVESHLGIENMFRVGLTPLDPEVNLEQLMCELGLLDASLLKAS